MTPKDPIEFCPAVACAAAIVRLEGFADQVARLLSEAQLSRSENLMRQLEEISDELTLASDDARDRLSKVHAVSAAGAMAQLLAAVHDIRVGDDAERERARDLEAKAVHFLGAAQLFDAHFCGRLSHTKLGRRRFREFPPVATRASLRGAP
jgi:hypothetical protein